MSINVNVGNIIPTNVVEVGNEISVNQLAAITAADTPSSTNPFSTAGHIHIIGNVTGLQTALDGKAGISHTHTISSITDLQTALDGKASNAHTHTIGNVTGLPEALSLKADTTHTHTIANVTGLQTALDGKSATSHLHTGVYAPATHSHAIADVTGLQTALDGKASTALLNGKLDLAGGTMTGGLVFALNDTDARITFNDGSIQSTASYSKAQSDANMTTVATWLSTKSDVGHTHTIANITGLQTALDSKTGWPQSWIEGGDIGRLFSITNGVLDWDNGSTTISNPATGSNAGSLVFNKRTVLNPPTATHAGINIGTINSTANLTNSVAGDVWIGTWQMAYKTANGTLVYGAATNASNVFGSPQVIDTTSNTMPAMRITQKGTHHAIVVEDSITPDASSFWVNTDGRVGIGGPSTWIDGNGNPQPMVNDATLTVQKNTNGKAAWFNKYGDAGTDGNPTVQISGVSNIDTSLLVSSGISEFRGTVKVGLSGDANAAKITWIRNPVVATGTYNQEISIQFSGIGEFRIPCRQV